MTPFVQISTKLGRDEELMHRVVDFFCKGAIEEVMDCSKGFYNQFILIPKPNGLKILILALTTLNKIIVKENFKM